MNRQVFLIGMLLCALSSSAQEASVPDTLRTELSLDEIGGPADLTTAGSGTGNWFVSLSGGVNSYDAEANNVYDNLLERTELSLRMAVGKWVTPVWGYRLQMGLGNLSGHYLTSSDIVYNIQTPGVDHNVMPDGMKPYLTQKDGITWYHRKFFYMDWSFNVMTDAVKWFSRKESPVGVILSAGPGFGHGFAARGSSSSNSFLFNAGVMLRVNVHKNWDVFAEMQGNIVDESFDNHVGGKPSKKRNRTVEGYAGLNVGVAYKFGGRKFARYAKVHPVTYETVRQIYLPEEKETVPEIVQSAKTEEVTPFVVRFFIDKYNIEEDQKLNIQRVARYLQSHPDARLALTGYADKETAYPSYNMKLSERRVKAVRNYLVKECGIEADRLSIRAKGDTERAYEEDYRWNRAVVMQIINK